MDRFTEMKKGVVFDPRAAPFSCPVDDLGG
jgi:hypothetical protein